jgi:hypothetical protein
VLATNVGYRGQRHKSINLVLHTINIISKRREHLSGTLGVSHVRDFLLLGLI